MLLFASLYSGDTVRDEIVHTTTPDVHCCCSTAKSNFNPGFLNPLIITACERPARLTTGNKSSARLGETKSPPEVPAFELLITSITINPVDHPDRHGLWKVVMRHFLPEVDY